MPRNTINIKVTGVKETQDWLHKIAEQVHDDVVGAIRQTTSEIEQTALRLVPVDTGRLKRSISKEIRHQGMIGRVKAETPYAPSVEYGSVRQPEQPFLRPAFERHAPSLRRNISKIIDNAIR